VFVCVIALLTDGNSVIYVINVRFFPGPDLLLLAGPLFRKKWGPYYMNTCTPWQPSPDTHSSHHRHFVENPCCNAHYYCLALWGHTKLFPVFHNHYFNISGLLPCCKKMKKNSCALVEAPYLWGPLFGWTCLNPPVFFRCGILVLRLFALWVAFHYLTSIVMSRPMKSVSYNSHSCFSMLLLYIISGTLSKFYQYNRHCLCHYPVLPIPGQCSTPGSW